MEKEEDEISLKQKLKQFECKICLDTANEPVVTQCGHLYCWKCIYDWSKHKRSKSIPCPICKNSVNIDKMIPLYTSVADHKKMTDKLPKRPRPERNEHQSNQRANAGNQRTGSTGATFYINGFPIRLGNGNWRQNMIPILMCVGFMLLSFFGEFFLWGSSSSMDFIDILNHDERRSAYNTQRRQASRARTTRQNQRRTRTPSYGRRRQTTATEGPFEGMLSQLYTVVVIGFIIFAYYYNNGLRARAQATNNRNNSNN